MIHHDRSPFIRIASYALLAANMALGSFADEPAIPQVRCEAAANISQPNVLVIYTDDQGSIDLNCYGAKDLATPNLDALAERGVRFTQMYSPSAICSASRAGLLTGRFPVRAGVPSNVSSQEGVAGMPAEQVTIAEMMKKAGYATGHIGKWHLGYTPDTMPLGQGFDYSYGHMGGCIDNYSHFFYWNGPNRHDLWRNGKEIWEDGQFFPDRMAEECIQFIDGHRDEKFFVYWAINVPHYPMQGTQKWRDHYKDLPAPRRMYAEFVSTMDEVVGRVLEHLAKTGLDKNTLIIFQSDHGHSTEQRAFYGGGNAGPFRGAKGCLFEGGLRVPSIVSLPGVIPQGEVRDQLAVGCDWLPTIAALTQVDLPQRKLDGKSLQSVIVDNRPSPHDGFYWQLGVGNRAQWVVRDGDWKLLGNPQDRSATKPVNLPPLFLVNLADDISEQTNVAAQHPDIVKQLEKLRSNYVQSLDE